MLSLKDIIRARRTKKGAWAPIHDGEGTGIVQPLFQDQVKAPIFIYYVALRPASTIGHHRHIGSEEVYYIVKGKGLMSIDDDVFDIYSGDVLLTESGKSHSLLNIGKCELEALVINTVICLPKFLIYSLASRMLAVLKSLKKGKPTKT